MHRPFRVLAINPGSTSTKIACFDDEHPLMEETLRHSVEELQPFPSINAQFALRRDAVLSALETAAIPLDTLSATVGRGGLIRPVSGGTYRVNATMLADLEHGVLGEHASNLGGVLAREIAVATGRSDVEAYIVDPVVVDELEPLARYSGTSLFERASIFHALNQRAVARKAADQLGVAYESSRFVVAHLGGGITVGAHRNGRVVDVNDGLNGDGPFTPERSGSLPALKIVDLCFSGDMDRADIKRRIKGGGGLVDYLGTNDGLEIAARIDRGDEGATEVLEAMAYQVAKEIGAMSTVLERNPDAILITGGYAYDERLVEWIRRRVDFLAPVHVYPGEDEMTALAAGALRVLRGEEQPREYTG